jgi:ELWxxDGT repeat protein
VTKIDSSSAPVELMFLSNGDTAYFAHISIGDTAIWRTDGTAAGTIKLDDEAGALMPLTTVDDTLYFKAILSNDAWELWRLGPADTEPTVVKQFDSSAFSPYAAAFGGKLYFYSHTKTSDLWVSDGTAEGTMPVADAASSVWPRFIDQVISTSERLYVIDHGGEHNWRFWESDGTAAGTRLIGEFEMPKSLTAIGSALYFDLHTGEYGSEPWVLRSETNAPGDLNGDGKIDLSDFGILKANFGTANALGDIDRNGRVDLDDFGLLKQAYGTPVDTTPAQAALRAAAVDFAIRWSVTDE